MIALEGQVLEARDADSEGAASCNGNASVADLEARLKTRVEELNEISDELKWATPCFRAYVLPQIGDIMGGHASFNSEERKDLESVIALLKAGENTELSEQLAAEIIARLRTNLEKSFGS